MILLLEPMTLVGTIFGVYIHHQCNDDILFIVLFAIIFLIAIRTLIKGYDTYNTTQLYDYNLCYDEVKDNNNETIHTHSVSYPSKSKMILLAILIVSTNSISSALFFIASSSLLPFKDMLIIILTLIFVVLLVMITLIIRLIIIRGSSYNYNKKLTPQRLAIYPVFGLSAGIIAGLLGIGGGLIKSPMLLAILDDNVEASATSSTMVFLTSVTALIGLNTKYTSDNNSSNSHSADVFPIVLFITGLIFTIIGQKISEYYIRKNTSLITISMGVAMLLSLALLVLQKMMIMN